MHRTYTFKVDTTKETLHEIQRKQNSTSGLAHITDNAFVCSKALDESLLNLETHETMNVQGQELYHYIKKNKFKPFSP